MSPEYDDTDLFLGDPDEREYWAYWEDDEYDCADCNYDYGFYDDLDGDEDGLEGSEETSEDGTSEVFEG